MASSRVRRRRRRGLATRLTWAFVLLAGTLLLIVGLVLTFVSYNAQLEQVLVRQQKTADEAAVVTAAYLSQAQSVLTLRGQVGAAQSLMLRSAQIQEQELRSVLNAYPGMFEELTLLDEEGNELARVSPFYTFLLQELGSRVGSSAFQQAIQGQTYVADQVQVSAYSSLPVIEMATFVKGGGVSGVLIAKVSIKGMWDAMAQVEVGHTGYAYIVDRHTGQLIAHSDLSRYLSLTGQNLEQVPVMRRVMAGEPGFQEQYEGLDGVPVIGAASPLPDTDWVLVAELPTREALASVRQMLYLLAILIVVGVLVAASLGLLIPRRIVRPLQTVQEGAQELGAGRLDHVIHVRTGDEIEDLAGAFNHMAANLRSSRAELERWGHELEERVEARTRELAEATERARRSAGQLQISAEVAQAITSIHDLNELLPEVARLISQRFAWYHVGIFLLDDERGAPGKYAVLQAANSEGGQRMLARGHRLKVGEEGIVGIVTGTGKPRIALDVGQDAVYFDNPDLPETRSEMALPLKLGDRVIGALDVQSTEPAAYDEEDVALLGTLADQVAVAIANARAFEETRRALEEVEKVQRQYVLREWAGLTSRQDDLSYEYHRPGVPTFDAGTSPEVVQALTKGDVVALSAGAGGDGDNGVGRDAARAALAAPIKLRDQIIGVLDLQETEQDRQWTDDEIAMVQAIGDQVALALENARLFADTQRRAEQLATLHRIGLAITSALDLNEVVHALYERVQPIMDASIFYVALYDEATGVIEYPLMINENGSIEVEPRSISDEPGLTGHVIQTGQMLHVADIEAQKDAPYLGSYVQDARRPRSLLAVPLVFREQTFGVLSLQSYEANAYSKTDAELLSTIATQTSIAIQNARAYERLVETAEQLREVDRLKTQFLANMSHELRTPLNSIIGFSRVMLKGIDGPLNELQETDLDSIYSSGQHLLSLINSILDMSKIEAGKMDLSLEELVLSDIFGSVLATARGLLKDRPVKLVSDLPDDLPTVWADSQRVRQVLINLVSNAAKFTEKGHIALRATADPEYVTISVRDSGIGMDEDAQKRLFIPFQQVDASTSRRAGGTGLGLAISRSFVEMQGGKIWVESEPGQGSTFFFTLPVYQAMRAREEAKGDILLDPDRKAVLAIDDDVGVITLLKRYLEGDGYQIIGVTQSHKAVETAKRLAPDLKAITLDVVMPNVDGWQVLRALKQDARTQDIPVILCSIVEGLDQGLGMGAAACLQKPVTRDEILDTLKQLERKSAQR